MLFFIRLLNVVTTSHAKRQGWCNHRSPFWPVVTPTLRSFSLQLWALWEPIVSLNPLCYKTGASTLIRRLVPSPDRLCGGSWVSRSLTWRYLHFVVLGVALILHRHFLRHVLVFRVTTVQFKAWITTPSFCCHAGLWCIFLICSPFDLATHTAQTLCHSWPHWWGQKLPTLRQGTDDEAQALDERCGDSARGHTGGKDDGTRTVLPPEWVQEISWE